jgi:hypothetical protein
MPAETATTTTQVPGIPLHLIPKTIADLIKDRRRPVYRITARKMFQNRYTLTVETRKQRSRRVKDKRTDTESGMPGRNE